MKTLNERTTIAPSVLLTIAHLTTLSVPGVNRMSNHATEVDRFFNPSAPDGVHILVENNAVYIDVYIVVDQGVIVREVCRAVQQQIARAIEEMVGMEIGKINVHVEDIEYSNTSTEIA